MKQLILPKSLPSYLVKPVNDSIEIAYGFMCAKYGYRFQGITLVFRPVSRKSCFRRRWNNETESFDKCSAEIAMTPKIWFYKRATIDKQFGQVRQGVNIGYTLNMAAAIVHEFTHYIQYLENRKYSEVETTANELEFFKVCFPEWYKRIVL